jgi:hypothetical protein
MAGLAFARRSPATIDKMLGAVGDGKDACGHNL